MVKQLLSDDVSQHNSKEDPAMCAAALLISGPEGMSEVHINPDGAVLGRGSKCDVVLRSPKVSRRHARIFRDPFSRWVIEDMHSRNGVWVDGERVSAHALAPGESVRIGSFELSLTEILDEQVPAYSALSGATTTLWEPPGQEITVGSDEPTGVLSQDHLADLNRILDGLAAVTEVGELYSHACRQLAAARGTGALVVRVPVSLEPLPDHVETLASCFGGAETDGDGGTAVHLSRGVLQVARDTGNPVMGTNRAEGAEPQGPDALRLTVADEHAPRAVFCAPVTEPSDYVDLLYLDIPADAADGAMLDFVRAVARQLGFVRKSLLLAKAQTEHVRFEAQLRLAQEIQSRLIPAPMKCEHGIDVAICYEPAAWVGGDYCDVWRLSDGRLAVAVGDVSGKGLPAAIVMANLQASLRSTTTFCHEPAEIMQYVNRLLIQNLPDESFITLFLGLLDCESGRLDFVNAGHLLPLLVRSGRDIRSLGQPVNMPLGTQEVVFIAQSETLDGGTALVAFTDGVTETMSPAGNPFGTDSLCRALSTDGFRRGEDFVQSVWREVSAFRHGLPQQDDLTVLAILRQNAESEAVYEGARSGRGTRGLQC